MPAVTCPRCRGPVEDPDALECPWCGVLLERAAHVAAKKEVERRREMFKPAPIAPILVEDPWTLRKRELRALLLEPRAGEHPWAVAARAAFLIFLVWWGAPFVFHPLDADRFTSTPVHNIHLVFHEAGHPLFGFLGEFMGAIGGSVMQVLVPIVIAIAFLRNEDQFGCAFGLMWAGHALMDVAPYIADARALDLVLLSGGTGEEFEGHDWEYILGRLGLLNQDVRLGRLTHGVGALVAACGAAYAAYAVARQWAQRSVGPARS